MKRNRVVNSAFDFFLKERVANRVAARAANDEQVITRLASLGLEDRLSVQRREQLAIAGGDYAAPSFHSRAVSSLARSTAAWIVSSREL